MSPQISWELVTQRITEESVKSSMLTRDQRPQEASYTQTLGQPPTHRARARSRAVQNVPSIKECSDVRVFLFPDEAGLRERLSQDRWGRARALPTHQPSPDDVHLFSTCAPSHMRVTAKGDIVGGGWTRGLHFMETNVSARQDSAEEDDDEDAAECLPKHRVPRLTCEATMSEPQRPRQAVKDVETSLASSLSLFGGVAQAFHDDRVVELRVQLKVEDVDGEG